MRFKEWMLDWEPGHLALSSDSPFMRHVIWGKSQCPRLCSRNTDTLPCFLPGCGDQMCPLLNAGDSSEQCESRQGPREF